MKARLNALLVHGMGSDPSWWNPFLPRLHEIRIDAQALSLPSLEQNGPGIWCEAVKQRIGSEPVILLGHSLGAAVCLRAALEKPVAQLILLALPPFVAGFFPKPPQSKLSVTALARVARYLRAASELADRVACEVVHVVGEKDLSVPVEHARKLPFPLVAIPSAGHESNLSPQAVTTVIKHIALSDCGRRHLDPGVRLALSDRDMQSPAEKLGLAEIAPPPARLDIEITTRCQLACPVCARTFGNAALLDQDMPRPVFERALDAVPYATELIFVGLGEPLLHPELPRFVASASQRGLAVKLVTNGLLATPERLRLLQEAGLTEITFSIDSADPTTFAQRRGGASFDLVLRNFRAVPAVLRKAIFTTLCGGTAGELPGIIDLAAAEKLPALVVSDVNFLENQPQALRHTACEGELRRAIRCARSRGVLLIGPHFHDVADLRRDYRLALVRAPADLTVRAARHAHCLSPWRILVVGVDGTVTPCNCAPRTDLGNIVHTSPAEIWNGEQLKRWRRAMLTASCRDCLACPRY